MALKVRNLTLKCGIIYTIGLRLFNLKVIQIYSNWVGGETAENAYLITFRIPRESPLFVRAVENEIHSLTAHRTTNSNEFIFKIV